MFGLLGHNIGYSYSPEIHKKLGYDYKLFDLDEKAFEVFMKEKNFKGINVTIPYKSKVIDYLDEIDDVAKRLGVVNTIVNRDGKLYGYNTDILGFDHSLTYHDVDLEDKKVLILGTGNTAESVKQVLSLHNPKEVNNIGRTTSVNYENLESVLDSQIIINTTPVGVKGTVYQSLVDVSKFNQLECALDVIYNPIRTKFISDALSLNKKAFGGLFMLSSQAISSSELFRDVLIDEEAAYEIFEQLLNEKENIVLIGMPTAGKTTIGKELSKRLNRKFYDVDELIVNQEKRSIPEIFAQEGETYFREVESSIIRRISEESSLVIASGGGSVLDSKNVEYLKFNGKTVFIDRPLNLLQSASDRPLSNDKNKLKQIYNERYEIYKQSADTTVTNDQTISDVVDKILEVIL